MSDDERELIEHLSPDSGDVVVYAVFDEDGNITEQITEAEYARLPLRVTWPVLDMGDMRQSLVDLGAALSASSVSAEELAVAFISIAAHDPEPTPAQRP